MQFQPLDIDISYFIWCVVFKSTELPFNIQRVLKHHKDMECPFTLYNGPSRNLQCKRLRGQRNKMPAIFWDLSSLLIFYVFLPPRAYETSPHAEASTGIQKPPYWGRTEHKVPKKFSQTYSPDCDSRFFGDASAKQYSPGAVQSSSELALVKV